MKHTTDGILQFSRAEDVQSPVGMGEVEWVDWWNGLEDGFCRTSRRGQVLARPATEREESPEGERPLAAVG